MSVATRVPVRANALFPIDTTFTVFDCANCGVLWAVTDEYDQRRRYDGASFYCPNGHCNAYIDAELPRLQRELREAQDRSTRLSADLDRLVVEKVALEKNHRKLKREHTATMRRITNGVCPCCQRTFKDVQSHMQRRHPDQVVTAEQAVSDA